MQDGGRLSSVHQGSRAQIRLDPGRLHGAKSVLLIIGSLSEAPAFTCISSTIRPQVMGGRSPFGGTSYLDRFGKLSPSERQVRIVAAHLIGKPAYDAADVALDRASSVSSRVLAGQLGRVLDRACAA